MAREFSCGHKGKGKYCHRCVAEALTLDNKRKTKEERKSKHISTGLDLSGLPLQVADKATEIITGLAAGRSHLEYGGKRLVRRDVIAIPVGRSHRILCIDGDVVVPREVLSHEDYNRRHKLAIKFGL